jgi:hypothetical protein
VSQHFRLSDHSLEDFNRMKILVIEQNKVQDLCSPPLINDLCVMHVIILKIIVNYFNASHFDTWLFSEL